MEFTNNYSFRLLIVIIYYAENEDSRNYHRQGNQCLPAVYVIKHMLILYAVLKMS